jgi:hypothetical protein
MNMSAVKIASLSVLLAQVAAPSRASTQTFDDVQVFVRGYTISDDGGEHSGVALSTGPVGIGQSAVGVFSVVGCGLFTVAGRQHDFEEGAVAGWRVEITPRRVVGHAVTFRLRWVRAINKEREFSTPNEDVELTLRPGESRPLDSVPVPQDGKTVGGPCKVRSASLRVTTDLNPIEQFERRLIAADLWLVERLANGKERSQAQSVRGLPNRPMPFYFDTIVDGQTGLDILGQVVARPDTGAMEVKLRTHGRWGDTPVLDGSYRTAGSKDMSRWLESVVQVNAGEIVEVALPKLGNGPFADRPFSIRIRARQLR